MATRDRADRLALVVLVVLISAPLLSQSEDVGSSEGAEQALRETVRRVRDVGAAMYQWHTDQQPPNDQKKVKPPFDVSVVPLISASELESMLVPDYLPELPTEDGWGRPLEIRLLRAGGSGLTMAIRSAGPDGEFAGTEYAPGSYPADDPRADVVWMMGYFVRWPGNGD